MQVLIVKLTSMGDVLHALPAVTDAIHAISDLHFDWVVDESFTEIPTLHPAIENVISVATRRWQKNKELITFWRNIRKKKYDLVIDAQNNLKSAIVTSFTRGLRCGMDKNSAREKFAHFVCDKTFNIPIKQHAIVRQRQLFAKALHYQLTNSMPNFGISVEKLLSQSIPIDIPKPYLVFVHSTTWNTKHWPEVYWRQLIQLAEDCGYYVVLPWGNASEQARAIRLAHGFSKTQVLPQLSITQQAIVILGAIGAVCIDTGLGHLTAALNTPAVHLYGPTDPELVGAIGRNQTHLTATYACAPCYLHDCKFGPEAACFLKHMQPQQVWRSLETLLAATHA